LVAASSVGGDERGLPQQTNSSPRRQILKPAPVSATRATAAAAHAATAARLRDDRLRERSRIRQSFASVDRPRQPQRLVLAGPISGASILADEMGGEIDATGARKGGLDAFLDEKVAEGFAIETRTDTHAIIFRRPKRLRRFRSGDDPGRFVVEVDEDGRATMRPAEPRRS